MAQDVLPIDSNVDDQNTPSKKLDFSAFTDFKGSDSNETSTSKKLDFSAFTDFEKKKMVRIHLAI